MCGICGDYHFDGSKPDLNVIDNMLQKLERRGPDNKGVFHEGSIALGHRRLSIIDLSERSNQPMVDNELQLALVFNGTIYNYPELRSELTGKGYHFFSDGDSEVILKAYAHWGEQCVERLHGMFAFAILDLRDYSLFAARDRLGIKPFYYSLDNNRFVFASNMQALLAAGHINTEINPVGLHHQLTLHAVIPAPDTILEGIKKLAPGTTIKIDANGGMQHHRYWHLKANRDPAKADWNEADWTEAIHDSLMDAVKKRLTVADVPVGVLLSGGLDSSLLVALLAEAGVNNIRTFSIGFNDIGDEQGSEFEYSDQVVERYNTIHHKYMIPNQSVLERLPEAITHMAEPMVGQDAVAFYLLSEKVSQEVKVVQSGQGADEVFAGYFWYPKMAEAASARDRRKKGSEVDCFAPYYFDRHHDEFLQAVKQRYHGKDHTSELVNDLLTAPYADDYLDKVLRMDTTTLIVDDPVKRVDNMTMAWGLEARVPFLDHKLVELAAQMPSQYKIGQQGAKHMLKTIARGKIPDAVIDRPKGYFPMPALKYVRGEFLDMMTDVLTSQRCRERGVFEPAYIQRLLKNPEAEENMTRLQGSKLWHMALLEMWLQTHVN
ncbi:MAG: N-acetylglutaminylglutamine amidotransferase [gamma proteobacterium symbiont of Lucinoma myriamae]|nr:N-acetylglutaminylglutamine amidotransferase [gamma proteobacterium symbiont of Lucinoma myriamae]